MNKASSSAATRPLVIYRLGSLGDTVVALPCLHRIAQSFPHAQRIMLTNISVSSKAAPLEAILGGSGLVHRYLDYPVGTRSVRKLMDLRATLRTLGADTLVYLTPSRGLLSAWRDLLYFRLCGFKHIVGAPLTHDLQRNRDGTDGLVEYECMRLARCMAALGPVSIRDPAAWDLHLTVTEMRAASAMLAEASNWPRIGINMGGKFAENDWGEANWLGLMTRLRSAWADHALVFVGAAEDAARAARVGALWPGPVVDLCGRVSPRVSAAAMMGSRVFVGHDSGPLHLAAAVGVPCVGLYGSKHRARKWHPFGERHRIIHNMLGTTAISIEEAAQAIESFLLESQDAAVPTSPEVLSVGLQS